MKRKVERSYIDQYIDRNYPDGISQLARESEIPANTISKIRANGYVPKNEKKLRKLAKACGASLDEVFPPIEEVAS
jgi:transcriptional regulator with XRE-family HTH domain